MGFVVQGLNTLVVSLAKASADVKAQTPARMEKVCSNIENTAKSIVPTRTGNLRDSITHDVTPGFGSVTGEVGPEENYGRFVEWGTSVMPPQAFMGPAMDRHSHEFEEELGDLGEI